MPYPALTLDHKWRGYRKLPAPLCKHRRESFIDLELTAREITCITLGSVHLTTAAQTPRDDAGALQEARDDGPRFSGEATMTCPPLHM